MTFISTREEIIKERQAILDWLGVKSSKELGPRRYTSVREEIYRDRLEGLDWLLGDKDE